MSRRHTPTLIHRGYLYAQGHPVDSTHEDYCMNRDELTKRRMKTAEAWRAGYLAAQRNHARKNRP